MSSPVQMAMFGVPDEHREMKQRDLFAAGEVRDESLESVAEAWAREHNATILGFEERPGLLGSVRVVRVSLPGGRGGTAMERELSIDDLRTAGSAA